MDTDFSDANYANGLVSMPRTAGIAISFKFALEHIRNMLCAT
jgi:hypothetical protein